MNRLFPFFLLMIGISSPITVVYGNQTITTGKNTEYLVYTGSDSITVSNFLPCNIAEDIVLTQDNSPFFVNCDIIVQPQATLIINPGVEIIFLDSCSIRIYGKLTASGSADKPIVLRPADNLPFWDTICLVNATDTCAFRWINLINGRLYAQNTHVVMDHVYQYNSKHLFWTDGLFTSFFGSLTINYCSFESNNTGEGLIFTYPEHATVENSRFFMVPDAIEYLNIIGGSVKNNLIIDPNDDGIDMNHSVDAVITGNRIYSSQDNGITLDSCQNILIEDNLLVDCSQGINFKNNAHGFLRNNTLYRNGSGIYLYEKYTGSGGGHVIIENCILSQSVNKAVDADEYSSYSMSYSLCDTESFPGTGNISSNPGFVSVADSNFRLLPVSPCIDAGEPSQTDPDGTRADIGAFFFNKGSQPVVVNEINYHSGADFDPGDWAELYNPEASEADISGWYLSTGDQNQTFQFRPNTLIPPGGYLILCNDEINFLTAFSGFSFPFKPVSSSFGNDGGLIVLRNEAHVLIDSLVYSNLAPWPSEPGGGGPSLELKNPSIDNTLGQNWCASAGHGSPGYQNTCFTQHIQENTGEELVSLFPNPATNRLTLSANGATVLSVRISDISGKTLIYNEFAVSYQYKSVIIDSNSLKPGIYLISAVVEKNGSQLIASDRLIITNDR